LQRANSDASAGVGVATYLSGIGIYKNLKDLNCNYAVNTWITVLTFIDVNVSFKICYFLQFISCAKILWQMAPK
tara:strand:+ start:422 stop:643 length:222 start_codon:yes stop_codon:yes gene_type:complete